MERNGSAKWDLENGNHWSWTEKKKEEKNEDSLRNIQENRKLNNIHIIGIPEGEEKEKGAENIFEVIIAENFNLGKKTDIQVQEAQRVPNKINQRGKQQETL